MAILNVPKRSACVLVGRMNFPCWFDLNSHFWQQASSAVLHLCLQSLSTNSACNSEKVSMLQHPGQLRWASLQCAMHCSFLIAAFSHIRRNKWRRRGEQFMLEFSDVAGWGLLSVLSASQVSVALDILLGPLTSMPIWIMLALEETVRLLTLLHYVAFFISSLFLPFTPFLWG